MPVALARHASRRESERPGGDDERPVGAGERLAERLDRAAVGVGRALEVARERDVVLERQVDHAVGRAGCLAQCVEIVERAALNLSAGGAERSGRGIRAGQAEDLMAGAESSGTTAEPIQPDAPVTKTRMREPPVIVASSASTGASDVSYCHHSSR